MSSATVSKRQKNDQAAERIEKIDFKMVTFSLAGKEYGIDIMKVKEISKAGRFTYVPNSAPYVRGVYNLRGDIISIIDLRIMFHLPAEKKQDDALENVLILRLEDHVLGVVVDSIAKVVGVSSESIQPPHPIFGDINIKYISGVVENNDRLYIILDVDRIFSREKEDQRERRLFASEPENEVEHEPAPAEQLRGDESDEELALSFISETLFAFRNFAVTPLNIEWMKARLEEWKKIRSREKADLQLKEAEEADRYLETFGSPCTGTLWSKEYADEIASTLPETIGSSITIWNPGCGAGAETYSFACLLKTKYPDKRIKIWANDNDLLSISTAPNMVFRKDEVPEWLRGFTVEGRNGSGFKSEIKDLIMFEYHDVLNTNPFEELDFILARDVLSFQRPEDQQRLIEEFGEKLRTKGILILGKNEKIPDTSGWKPVGSGDATGYCKGGD
jgi:purine-binding chemotaxis protein CheW